jgi:hypothetical protein
MGVEGEWGAAVVGSTGLITFTLHVKKKGCFIASLYCYIKINFEVYPK